MHCELLSFITYVSFHKGQHLYHNANNLPLWTWWEPYWCLSHQVVEPNSYIKQHQDTPPLWHQGQRTHISLKIEFFYYNDITSIVFFGYFEILYPLFNSKFIEICVKGKTMKFSPFEIHYVVHAPIEYMQSL